MKKYFDVWVDVSTMNDQIMAQRIVDDKIDILVDLAGHTLGNRLLVFAMRPAPIQVTYMGYGYTTGLKEIDYFIGDDDFTPSGCEPYFSEKIWRVPAPLYCYEPPSEITPPVNELPALKKGYITFGSLTRTIRLNDHLLEVWKKILDQIPNSRLRLDQSPFLDVETREYFYKRLINLGFRKDQVDLTYSKPHWNAYHDIDIALDCFPHNTGTTTYDALWMGVPVLTKIDRPSVGRFGVCILNAMGLVEWVTEDEESYIQKAVELSRDLVGLSTLRSVLRDRMKNCDLMNFEGMSRKLEVGYKEMMKEMQRSAS
jgi:predicted O-linked N-acetylglucosamine transferase (SPINDLY family)